MSYIIKCTDPFVSIKLTEVGREQLAKGQLNFVYWAAGDSEVNYDREANMQNYPSIFSGLTSQILRPKDRQPDLKSYVSTGTTNVLNNLTPADMRAVKVVVNNVADTRGFFSGTTGNFTTLTGSPYTVSVGTISATLLTGGTTIQIGTGATYNVGDFLLLKLGSMSANTNTDAYPHLWYKIQVSASTTEITVDRTLPKLSGSGLNYQYIIYKGGEVKDAFGLATPTAYWDSATLSFESSCNISVDDVPVWNMNNVWQENLAGMSGTSSGLTGNQGFDWFGSYDYLGTMNPYLDFDLLATSFSSATSLVSCQGTGGVDIVNKSLAIIHYTNYTISNYYGEFFYIDTINNKNLKLYVPDLMYHRISGTTSSATTMGMVFQTSGDVKTVGSSQIEYYDLIEDPTLITSGGSAVTVGRVYPQLKIVTIHDEEVVAALSYKSNRNWTLPSLALTLQSPSGTIGILQQNKTMYLTYVLENTGITGFTTALPCQKYSKISNLSDSPKDIALRLEGMDLLPYMRKKEAVGYDGYGFYATNFKVLYQIVDDSLDRPVSDAWKQVDLTSTAITVNALETISPALLENQNPSANGFVLTFGNTSGATYYDSITEMELPDKTEPNYLQFGDERFFYGNIDTYIGATIYKSIFNLRLSSSDFIYTTNPTRSTDSSTNPPDIMVSEIGIYDSNRNLVLIGKMSEPVSLVPGQITMFELSIDF